MVGQFAKQWLGLGVTPSQGVKADALMVEIYLATHQRMAPMLANLAGVSEQDHRAFERRIEVEFESFGKRAASGSTVSSQGSLGPIRSDR